MKPLWVFFLTLLGLSLMFFSSVSALAAKQPGTLDLITQAYQKGQIDYETSLIYKVQSIKNRDLLPAHLDAKELTMAKCATPILLEVASNWDRLSSATQVILKELLLRPTRQYTYDSPEGHFKIHYDKTGTHAVPTADGDGDGTPDYIEWLADYADSVWRTEITHLGYLEPPSDGSAGGDSRYDIYTENMPYYGYAQPESPGPRPWNDYTSYISVHRNFYGFPPNDDPEGDQKGAMKVTVAHEYFHAVQFGYDVYESSWYMEISSTWMEDVAYDVVNDNYNYLPDFFNYPDVSLQATTMHMYASFIWNSYLAQNFGNEVILGIWIGCIWHSALWSMDSVLVAKGSSRDQEFKIFTSWNFVTGSRDDGLHYEEGSHYPLIYIMRTHSTYPVTNQSSTQPPDNLASNYVRFLPSSYTDVDLHISFNGHDSYLWGAMVIKSQSVNSHTFDEISLNASRDGEIVIPNFDSYYAVTLVPSVLSTSGSNINYLYSAYLTPSDTTHGARVEAGADVGGINASTVEVDFYLENTGIVVDTFDVTVSDLLGWGLFPTSFWTVLDSHQIDTLEIQVSIPYNATLGSVDKIILSAVSRGNPWYDDSDTLSVSVNALRGDLDLDERINLGDIVFLINYLYKGGPAPAIFETGDINCDTNIDIGDAVFLIAYLYRGGPYPCSP